MLEELTAGGGSEFQHSAFVANNPAGSSGNFKGSSNANNSTMHGSGGNYSRVGATYNNGNPSNRGTDYVRTNNRPRNRGNDGGNSGSGTTNCGKGAAPRPSVQNPWAGSI